MHPHPRGPQARQATGDRRIAFVVVADLGHNDDLLIGVKRAELH